jgi:rhodanese-related sulfurtransferase
MKKVILILLSLTLLSCSEAQEEKVRTEVNQTLTQNVSAEEFQELIKGEGVVLDVRTSNEYVGGHLENSQNIDVLASTFADKVNKLDKTKPVYVYCKSGGRSGRAMNQMKGMGFATVYNLVGGYNGWSSKGLPTVK